MSKSVTNSTSYDDYIGAKHSYPNASEWDSLFKVARGLHNPHSTSQVFSRRRVRRWLWASLRQRGAALPPAGSGNVLAFRHRALSVGFLTDKKDDTLRIRCKLRWHRATWFYPPHRQKMHSHRLTRNIRITTSSHSDCAGKCHSRECQLFRSSMILPRYFGNVLDWAKQVNRVAHEILSFIYQTLSPSLSTQTAHSSRFSTPCSSVRRCDFFKVVLMS